MKLKTQKNKDGKLSNAVKQARGVTLIALVIIILFSYDEKFI